MRREVTLSAVAVTAVLLVAGCGGGSPPASQSQGPAPPASASPTHSAVPGEPALVMVPGYEYTNVQASIAQRFAAVVRANPGVYLSSSAHTVQHNGATIAAIFLLRVRAQFAESQIYRQALAGKARIAAQQMGLGNITVSRQTIESEPVYTAAGSRDGQRAVFYLWLHGDVDTAVLGPDNAATRDFVTAYLRQAHATGA